MGDEKDKDKGSEVLATGNDVPPVVESIPSTLDDLKKLESSIMAQMQSMLAGFLAPKENLTPSAGASPNVAPAMQPLIKFVLKTYKPIEKGPEGAGTSTPMENGEPKGKGIQRVIMRCLHRIITLQILPFLCLI